MAVSTATGRRPRSPWSTISSARATRSGRSLDIDVPVGELAGDLEFLMRAVRKVEAIREDLGKVGPVIAEQVQEAMLGRRAAGYQAGREGRRTRQARCSRLNGIFSGTFNGSTSSLDETRRELRLSPENIEQVVKVGLNLAGQPELIPTTVERKGDEKSPAKYPPSASPPFPAVGHYAPKVWPIPTPRRSGPLFSNDNLAKGHDDVVLAHLNHRLVAMCLRLLRAEVWSTEGKKRLNRITARLVPDTVLRDPAMIAHARLVVIGGDSHRLHEELITAGGLLREGRFARMNVGQVQDALAAMKVRRAVPCDEEVAARICIPSTPMPCVPPWKPA